MLKFLQIQLEIKAMPNDLLMTHKKLNIVARTIEEDQFEVATQWANTFSRNPQQDIGTQMMQLTAACVAAGDFKIKPHLSNSNALQSPSDQLTVVDYLSHASRIILDYQELSVHLQRELLHYFPTPEATNNVVSRSATHNVTRKDNQIIEGKGILLGVYGQLPSLFLNVPRDFGVNIAMGGEGHLNFCGKKISSNGYSGHVYFHSNQVNHLLMVGLEQSAPSSAMSLLLGEAVYPEDEQQHHDQFGQGHSLTGASDIYTAAGSLYFSDPVYQVKLMLEKGCLPPDKYGAMQVTINDENWSLIKNYLDNLQKFVRKASLKELRDQLLQKPTTAKHAVSDYKSYIALDFDQYLKRINQVFIETSELTVKEKIELKSMEGKLLGHIKALQLGQVEHNVPFTILLEKIVKTERLPVEYKEAINRIKELFLAQLQIDTKLSTTHQELVLKEQYDVLYESRTRLLQQAVDVQYYFQSEHVEQDEAIMDFLFQLNQQIARLQFPHIQPSSFESMSDMTKSWVVYDSPESITSQMVSELEAAIEQCAQVLGKAPKLYSQTTVEVLHHRLDQQISYNAQLVDDLSKKEKVIVTKERMNQGLASELVLVTNQRNQEKEQKESLQQTLDFYKQQAVEEQMQLRLALQRAQTQYELLQQQGQRVEVRLARIAPVLNNVNEMKRQAEDLSAKSHQQAQDLITAMERIISQYSKDSNLNEDELLTQFKENCKTELNKPREGLYEHRGFKRLICNTLLAVALLGVGYIAAIAVNRLVTGNYIFFNDTRSSKCISEIRNSVNDLEVREGFERFRQLN